MLRKVRFVGPDIVIVGYEPDPIRSTEAEIPVLPNNFYPTLQHSDEHIENKIQKKRVRLPSLRSLHRAGYPVDDVVVVAEILVHPKHIKNKNFLHMQLPNLLRRIAEKNKILLIVPALDIPTMRVVRKETLAALREAGFPPLYVGGKRYTSGYMKFFAVFPDDAGKSVWKKHVGVREDAVDAYQHMNAVSLL